jgi:acyl-CoA thioester hydrolase
MTSTSEDHPTSGRIDDGAHLFPVRIYYEDTDFSGAVYHANYLKFFERGRSEFLRLAGIGHKALLERPEPIAFAVTKLNIEYRASAKIDDALIVRTRFLSGRGARMSLDQELLRAKDADGVVICRAAVEIACIAPGGGGRRLPREVIDALAPYISSPDA